MRHLKRLSILKVILMLFLLVREMWSFYAQRHSSMIPSLTFISCKIGQLTNGFIDVTPFDLFQAPEFGFYVVCLKKFLHRMCY